MIETVLAERQELTIRDLEKGLARISSESSFLRLFAYDPEERERYLKLFSQVQRAVDKYYSPKGWNASPDLTVPQAVFDAYVALEGYHDAVKDGSAFVYDASTEFVKTLDMSLAEKVKDSEGALKKAQVAMNGSKNANFTWRLRQREKAVAEAKMESYTDVRVMLRELFPGLAKK